MKCFAALSPRFALFRKAHFEGIENSFLDASKKLEHYESFAKQTLDGRKHQCIPAAEAQPALRSQRKSNQNSLRAKSERIGTEAMCLFLVRDLNILSLSACVRVK